MLQSVPVDDRDAWIDNILEIDPPPPDHDLPRGGVPYIPCGVAEILSMIASVPVTPADTVIDIGSGLGRVVLIAHLLTGARGHGVELQPHLVARAREICVELNVTDVTFECLDAGDATLDGSILFLYSPTNGAMRVRMLERMHELAQRRRIVVCTVDLELDDVKWLKLRPSSAWSALAIYDVI
jgi:SAM-dependent methyltransferase